MLSPSAPLSTITGGAAVRLPRVASTLPLPTHRTARGPLCAVNTKSPAFTVCTGTSPAGVLIIVPAQKQITSTVLADTLLLSTPSVTVQSIVRTAWDALVVSY